MLLCKCFTSKRFWFFWGPLWTQPALLYLLLQHLLPCPSGSWLRWRSRRPGCDSGQCHRAAVLVHLNVRRPLATQVTVLRLISPMANAAPAVDYWSRLNLNKFWTKDKAEEHNFLQSLSCSGSVDPPINHHSSAAIITIISFPRGFSSKRMSMMFSKAQCKWLWTKAFCIVFRVYLWFIVIIYSL